MVPILFYPDKPGFVSSHIMDESRQHPSVQCCGRAMVGFATFSRAFITSVLLFSSIAVKSTAGMYAFSALYGLFASALQAMFPATLADLTTDHKKMGTRLRMGFALSSFGVLVGDPGGGKLIERGHGRYTYGQALTGACGMLGFLCFLLAAIIHK